MYLTGNPDYNYTQEDIAAKINQDFVYLNFAGVGAAASNVVDLGGVISDRTITDAANADWTDRPGAFFPDSTSTPRYMRMLTDDESYEDFRSVIRLDTGATVLILMTIDVASVSGSVEDVSEYFFTMGEMSGGSPTNGIALRNFTSGTGALGLICRDKGGNSSGELSAVTDSVLGGAGVYSVAAVFDTTNRTVNLYFNGGDAGQDSGTYATSEANRQDFDFSGESDANSFGASWFESVPNDSENSGWIGTLNMNVNSQNFGMRDFGVFKFNNTLSSTKLTAIMTEHTQNPGLLPRALMNIAN